MKTISLYTRSKRATLLTTVAVAAACSSAPQGAAIGPEPAVAQARIDRDTRPYTAADVQFMSTMIGHHAQAVQMSRLAPTRAASPAVRTLAERIINTQQDEIATLQQWLRDRGQPVPEVGAGGTMGGHHHHEHTMPGMLTEAELKQLEQARGAEFDRLFLTYMIRHHQGAVGMVTELLGNTGAAQDVTVFQMASDINVDQQTEIARMQRMLADLIFETGSP